MVGELQAHKKRKDLACLTLKVGDTWSKAKELARLENRSISAFMRELINRAYKKNKQRLTLTSVQ